MRKLLAIIAVAVLCMITPLVGCTSTQAKIVLSRTSLELSVGESYDAGTLASVDNNANAVITYSSSDSSVLEINGKSFVAKAVGNVVVTVSSEGVSSETISVQVKNTTYQVTFKAYNNETLKAINVIAGNKILAADAPNAQRESSVDKDYTFGGWLKANGDVWNFENDVVEANTVLMPYYTESARLYTIRFDGEPQRLQYGVEPTIPSYVLPSDTAEWKYTAIGFALDANSNGSFDEGEEVVTDFAVTSDANYVTAYTRAKCTYTVKFDLVEQEYEYGAEIVAPSDPFKAGFAFRGWVLDTNGNGIADDGEDVVTEFAAVLKDVSYVASFEVVETVTVKFDGVSQQVVVGSKANAPANPSKDSTAQYDYTFLGWVVDKNSNGVADGNETEIITDFTVSDDTNFVSLYESKVRSYTVKFDDIEKTYPYGEVAIAPTTNATPEDDNDWDYTFLGWVKDVNGNGVADDNEIAIVDNFTVTGPVSYVTKYSKTERKISVKFDGKETLYKYNAQISAPAPQDKDDAEWDYTFLGWVEDKNGNGIADSNEKTIVSSFGKATKNVAYVATYSKTKKKYEVTVNGNTSTMEYGSFIPQPSYHESDSKYGVYEFLGYFVVGTDTVWDFSTDFVNGEVELEYRYSSELKTVSVKLDCDNGTVITLSVVPGKTVAQNKEGTAIRTPEKQSEALTYTFVGWVIKGTDTVWDINADIVTDTVELVATYTSTARLYRVYVYDYDGESLYSGNIAYGESIPMEFDITYPDTTNVYDYAFYIKDSETIWDMDSDVVTGRVELELRFTISADVCYVSFLVDGQQYYEDVCVRKGESLGSKMPANPSDYSEGAYDYTFVCWEDENGATVDASTVITENTNFYAKFDGVLVTYTVKVDGVEQTVNRGELINAPTPTKEATNTTVYTFDKWVIKGTNTEWKISSDVVTGEVEIESTFSESVRKYSVTVDGKIVASVEYNAPIGDLEPPTKEADGEIVFVFSHWTLEDGTPIDPATYTVTKDLTLVAVFSAADTEIVVTFRDYDGSWIKDVACDYDTLLAAPEANPTREWDYDGDVPTKAYAFDGWYNGSVKWNFATDKVTRSITLVAGYKDVNIYTVTFKIRGGADIKTEYYEDGSLVTEPATIPTKESVGNVDYVFSKWCVNSTNLVWNFSTRKVSANVTIEAVFTETPRKYTVTFKNEGESEIISTSSVAYGSLIEKPETPTKEPTATIAYVFDGWYVENSSTEWNFALDTVKGETVLEARYTTTDRQYNIKFVNYDGSEITSVKTLYDTKLTAPSVIPTRASSVSTVYTFAGYKNGNAVWNFTSDTVKEEIILTAYYTESARKYIVSFYNYNGTAIEANEVEYGAEIALPTTTPTKPSSTTGKICVFTGWDGYTDGMKVSGDHNFTAKFEEIDANVTVSGTVKNTSGAALAASVYLGETLLATANASGQFSFSIYSATYTFTFKMNGYFDRSVNFSAGVSGSNVINAVMEADTVGEAANFTRSYDKFANGQLATVQYNIRTETWHSITWAPTLPIGENSVLKFSLKFNAGTAYTPGGSYLNAAGKDADIYIKNSIGGYGFGIGAAGAYFVDAKAGEKTAINEGGKVGGISARFINKQYDIAYDFMYVRSGTKILFFAKTSDKIYYDLIASQTSDTLSGDLAMNFRTTQRSGDWVQDLTYKNISYTTSATEVDKYMHNTVTVNCDSTKATVTGAGKKAIGTGVGGVNSTTLTATAKSGYFIRRVTDASGNVVGAINDSGVWSLTVDLSAALHNPVYTVEAVQNVGTFTVSGLIESETGDNSNITVTLAGATAITNSDGSFVLTINAGAYTDGLITFEKANHYPLEAYLSEATTNKIISGVAGSTVAINETFTVLKRMILGGTAGSYTSVYNPISYNYETQTESVVITSETSAQVMFSDICNDNAVIKFTYKLSSTTTDTDPRIGVKFINSTGAGVRVFLWRNGIDTKIIEKWEIENGGQATGNLSFDIRTQRVETEYDVMIYKQNGVISVYAKKHTATDYELAGYYESTLAAGKCYISFDHNCTGTRQITLSNISRFTGSAINSVIPDYALSLSYESAKAAGIAIYDISDVAASQVSYSIKNVATGAVVTSTGSAVTLQEGMYDVTTIYKFDSNDYTASYAIDGDVNKTTKRIYIKSATTHKGEISKAYLGGEIKLTTDYACTQNCGDATNCGPATQGKTITIKNFGTAKNPVAGGTTSASFWMLQDGTRNHIRLTNYVYAIQENIVASNVYVEGKFDTSKNKYNGATSAIGSRAAGLLIAHGRAQITDTHTGSYKLIAGIQGDYLVINETGQGWGAATYTQLANIRTLGVTGSVVKLGVLRQGSAFYFFVNDIYAGSYNWTQTNGAASGVGVAAVGTVDVTISDFNASTNSALLTALKAKVPTAKNIDVYFIAGQSNGAGFTRYASSTNPLTTTTVMQNGYPNIYYSGKALNPTTNSTNYSGTNISFQNVKLGQGISSAHIGPELGMADALSTYYNASTGRTALIIKYAVGGTSLFNDLTGQNYAFGNWVPPSYEKTLTSGVEARTGGLYDNFLATVQDELAVARAKGYEPQIKGFYWMQGCSNRGNTTLYKNVFTMFVSDMRSNLTKITGKDCSALPFFVGEISDTVGITAGVNESSFNGTKTTNQNFNAMLNTLPSAISKTYVVDNSGYAINALNSSKVSYAVGTDVWHWSGKDAFNIGRGVGNSILANIFNIR